MKQKNMNASCSKGIVYKKTFGSYEVHQGEKVISCLLSSHLRKELSYAEPAPNSHRGRVRKVKFNDDVDPVAVGDEVAFLEAQDGTAVIIDVLPRRTKLNRKTAVPMPSARPFEQIIVANLDQVVPVFAAANPKPKWALLDRYLVSAESLDLPVLICITKLDLVQGRDCVKDELPEGELREMVAEYRRIGYPVVLVSSLTGDGLEELRKAFQRRASVLVGKSGVGKSSLLNALQPGLGLKVNEVSRVSGKGKHTTCIWKCSTWILAVQSWIRQACRNLGCGMFVKMTWRYSFPRSAPTWALVSLGWAASMKMSRVAKCARQLQKVKLARIAFIVINA